MVDIKTAIYELNTGKIEFDYKDDDCCTTEGEVVILLKRLAELETADVVEVVRCRKCKYGDVSVHSRTKDGQEEIACYCNLKNAVTDVDGYCSSGERSDT